MDSEQLASQLESLYGGHRYHTDDVTSMRRRINELVLEAQDAKLASKRYSGTSYGRQTQDILEASNRLRPALYMAQKHYERNIRQAGWLLARHHDAIYEMALNDARDSLGDGKIILQPSLPFRD